MARVMHATRGAPPFGEIDSIAGVKPMTAGPGARHVWTANILAEHVQAINSSRRHRSVWPGA
eukprot:365680-Chlamydomonas_euryale.AAC.9